MNASNAFTQRFAIQPVVQAPMAGVATPQLAAAICNAGGLGSLGIGASTLEQARRMIDETRQLTDRPFNVNVFCHAPAQRNPQRERAWLEHVAPLFQEVGVPLPEALDEVYKSFLVQDALFDMLLETAPAVVSFHFGLPPAERIQALRRAGIYTLATATNLHEARLIEDAGVDAIVAQGIEAGGHRGMFEPGARDEQLSTAVLVRLLLGQTRCPVIAAGGIMDGHGVRAALELGAAAAQLGTAFILCPESSANAGYRAMLKSERASRTQLTSTLSGRPARGLLNRYITHGHLPGSPPVADYPVAYDAAKQLMAAAASQGNHEFAAHWAGQGAPLAREMPAAMLLDMLLREMNMEWRPGD